MVAGIFAQHGVWTGKCREGNKYNEKGYFENLPIQKLLVKDQGKIVEYGHLGRPIKGLRKRVDASIRGDGYKTGRWLFKGSVLYWPAFYEYKTYVIVCRRPAQQIFDSCRTSRGVFGKNLSNEELMRNILFHQEQMDHLASKGAYEVNTSQVVNGYFASIETAVRKCGIKFDEKLADDFVDRSLWKHDEHSHGQMG